MYLEVNEAYELNNLGWYLLFLKEFALAKKYLKQGIKADQHDLYLWGNLAHAYLLSNDLEQAKTIDSVWLIIFEKLIK